jgi:hypothetical protein
MAIMARATRCRPAALQHDLPQAPALLPFKLTTSEI